MRRIAALAAVAALAFVPSALACSSPPSLLNLESALVCVQCHEPLDMSTSPLAVEMKAEIRHDIEAGWCTNQIIHYFVVTAGFGEQVLASPPTHGFNLLAWVIPILAGLVGLLVVGTGAWVWTRNKDADAQGSGPQPAGGPALAPALEARVDQELAAYDG